MEEPELNFSDVEYEEEPDIVGNILLPYQGEDWEFANENQQSGRYLDSINVSREDQVPFNLRELGSFYYNPLLERSELYADQFIENSDNVDLIFERLLKVLEKASETVIKLGIDIEEKSRVIHGLCQKVFDTKPEQIKAEGYCQDQYKVSTVHRHNTCSFNEQIASDLKFALVDNQRLATEDGTLALYTKTLAQLQCVQFLCNVSANAEYHMRKQAQNSDTVKSSILVKLADESIDVVRQCINTIFKFIRKDDDGNEPFLDYLKTWGNQLVCLLYKLTKESGYQHLAGEEQFIVNHVIRSPPNMQSWASCLVQITFPESLQDWRDQKFFIDHIIYLLLLILRAPKGRGKFLRESKSLVKIKSVNDENNDWIFVEDSGEYLKGVGSQWHVLPRESDMVSLYQQVPFERMLSEILSLEMNDRGCYTFKETDVNSNKFLYVIACCDVMCDILGEGLATLGTPKYKQLVRRIGQTLRNVVILIAEYWNFYQLKVVNCPQPHSHERLQTEFDEFVKRCVERLLSVAQLGVYQFLADLPFKDVSIKAAETMYVLMNVPAGSRVEVDHLVTTQYSRQEWTDFVQDSDTKLAFEDHLSSMPENEIVYLLTTFCNLACSQPNTEHHLVNIIATDLYTISFVYASTRDICCKMGRELLYSLAVSHPFVISTILHHVNMHSEEMSLQAFYAISDLPYNRWLPVKEDLEMLRLWMLDNTTPPVFGKLAPITLKSLNYGKTDDGFLFLPHKLHCDIAMILLEIRTLHEFDAKDSGVVLKGIDKVSRIAHAVRTSLTIDNSIQTWIWDVLLRLKLNRDHLKCSETFEYLDKPAPLIDCNDVVILPKSISDQNPEACYIAIMMTNVGHSLNVFLQHGIPLLKVLAGSAHKDAAICCLATIVKMFLNGNIDLSINAAFIDALQLCLASEESVIGNIASKIVQSELVVPQHLQLLMGLIAENLHGQNNEHVLSYWLKLILNIPLWWEGTNMMIMLDFLLKCAFTSSPECNYVLQEIIYSKQLDLIQAQKNKSSPKHQNRSVISSILTYVGAENSSGVLSFLPNLPSSFLYLSYYVLCAEERYENEMHLWTSIITLVNTNSVQSSVKKAVLSLNLGVKPATLPLAIYRWIHLILLAPDDHAILPVLCQKFFQRYIFINQSTGSSSGVRFFTSPQDSDLLRKLKSKFSSLSTGAINKNKFCVEKKLEDLYRTFELWLDEDKLHDSNLYLPSLPSHYRSDLLAAVRTRSQSLWLQFVNFDTVTKEIQRLFKYAVDTLSEKQKGMPSSLPSSSQAGNNSKINHILKQFEPPIILDQSSSTGFSFPILVDQLTSSQPEALCDSIKSDIKSSLTHARYFTDSKIKLDVLDHDYIEMLPDLYSNEEQRRLIKIECQSAFSPTHSCAGPSQVQLRFQEKTLNEVVSERLKNNRVKYRDCVATISNEASSEDFGFSAVHLLTVVQALVEKLKNNMQSEEERHKLMRCGANLFFELADLNSDERWTYPPTRHLLLTSIDLLGQNFIFGQPDQAVPLLEQMLKRPEMAAVLSSHFSPGSSCSNVIGGSGLHNEFDTGIFAQMYRRIVNASAKGENCDVLFVLITKFDLESWCTDYNPPNSERVSLLESIINGLKFQFISTPSVTQKASLTKSFSMQLSTSAIQEVFITHLSILVKYSTDKVFFECIRLLLNASREKKIDPKAWNAVIDPDILILTTISGPVQISYECVDMCVKHLAVFFSDERKNTQVSLFGSWQQYISSLAKLMRNLIIFEIGFNDKMRSAGHTQCMGNHALINDRILPLFSPWISVMQHDGCDNVCIPWLSEEQNFATPILNAITSLVNEICAMNMWDIPQCVSTLWSFYLENTLVNSDEIVPEYIVSCYQSIIGDIPWDSFIPNLADLDKMVQLCHTNAGCVMHYLCHMLPMINWVGIIEMCKTKDGDAPWVEHTGELLSYFLQILLFLCSDETRLNLYHDLKSLMSSAADFPWHLIGYEEFELLANITTDRYHARCCVWIPSDTRLQSPSFSVYKLFQIASGIPLFHSFDLSLWKSFQDNQIIMQTIWMKRQSFVRCLGTMIRNASKSLTQSDMTLLEDVTAVLVEQLLKSILLIVKYDTTAIETSLMDLYSELWKIFSKFRPNLQDIVVTVVIKFLDGLILDSGKTESSDTCDRNAFVHLVLMCNLSACFHVISDGRVLSTVSEHSFHNCIKYTESVSNFAGRVTENTDLTLWTSLRHTLLEYGRFPQASFLESCLSNCCGFSLLASAQNLFDSTQNVNAKEKISLQGLGHLLVGWVSKLNPKHEYESKIMLFLAYLFKIYHQIEKDILHTNEQSHNHFVAENLGILIPVFEQWSVDRVKSGILGSLGIGRASQLSMGFRLSIRILSHFILNSVCSIQPSNEEMSKKLHISLANLKKLPSMNQIYRAEGQHIEGMLEMIQSPAGGDLYVSLFDKLYSFYFSNQHHLLTMLQ